MCPISACEYFSIKKYTLIQSFLERSIQVRESKTTLIFNQMKKDINEGVYSPNEKLVEADLAARYQTSRNTIRNVLSLLEKDNLVTIEPHKGAKVVSLNLKEIINLLDLRAEVEGYIFKKVAPTILQEDILAMEKIYKSMEKNIHDKDFQDHSDLNNAFHEVIYSKCDNVAATNLVRDLKSQVSKYNFKTILIPGRQEATLTEHKNILEAIKSKNGELASQRVKEHIYSVRDTLTHYNSYLNQ
jgi:DNA-binding GntR family transcriptional regulator